jgi:DNA-binding PadR family transcriptional regulator
MPLQHAVLALLAERSSYGYELKASFEQAVGPQWGSLNIGHLYQILDRLVRDGLVNGSRVAQEDRPDKIVYRLTLAGRVELDGWLAEPVVRQGGYRDDFFLKLVAAARLGPDRLDQVIAVQREAYMAELHALGVLEQAHHGDALVNLLIRAAVLHTEASLEVVELASRRADQLVEAGPAADEAAGEDPPGPATAEQARGARRVSRG